MTPKDIKTLKITDEIVCAPKPYVGEADLIGGDYEVNATLLNVTKRQTIDKIKSFLNAEEDYMYGPSTSYKNKYSYNRDD